MSGSILKEVRPMSADADFRNGFARVVADSAGKVCSVCGLGNMGHAPESRWLGYERHEWDGVPATREDLDRADKLTTQAYRQRD